MRLDGIASCTLDNLLKHIDSLSLRIVIRRDIFKTF